MPQTSHTEKHFTSGASVRDIIIGMSDGLTVPFALAAGLSGAVVHTSIIVVAGLAEMVAGSISMGVGGYLAAKNDADHYYSEEKRENWEVQNMPNEERLEVAGVFQAYGLDDAHINPILDAFQKNPDKWVDFMMRYELGLEKPDEKRAPKSALTIGLSYIAGGIVPLAPYFFMQDTHKALLVSAGLTLIALIIFGYAKSKLIGTNPFQGAWRTALLGALAAGAAYYLAKLIS